MTSGLSMPSTTASAPLLVTGQEKTGARPGGAESAVGSQQFPPPFEPLAAEIDQPQALYRILRIQATLIVGRSCR
jgi:hypothetical protein